MASWGGRRFAAGGGSGSAPARCARLRCAAAPTGECQGLTEVSVSNKKHFLVLTMGSAALGRCGNRQCQPDSLNCLLAFFAGR